MFAGQVMLFEIFGLAGRKPMKQVLFGHLFRIAPAAAAI